ncbi:MAG: phosphoribosylformylglycinamidine synthase [Christensenellales bacterium]|jgi:phosphoribosylformylglycinamidine synthase
MVYRVLIEKKRPFAVEAKALESDLQATLGLPVERLRILNRYDVQGIDEDLFETCKKTVFSEPQLDDVVEELDETAFVFAVEYLPGQFDQRADSAAQCIQLISRGERPIVRTAKVFVIDGDLTEADIEKIKYHVINPVESREAPLEKPARLDVSADEPGDIPTVDGFIGLSDDEAEAFAASFGLAMDGNDVLVCRDYFQSEGRNPTMTELKVIDTYWSDHCRHTTFHTEITDAAFEDARAQAAFTRYLDIRKELGIQKPVTLMDLATIAAKYHKMTGRLTGLDESEEINACTVKIKVRVDEKEEDYLLLFKNETHNHPTEIEPFGGAATCIGGAIRDPLSGRGYVYQAMRISGGGDPTRPFSETLPNKLPQKKLLTTAAAGYSSYGNQVGVATGLVDEVYHPGYVAKHMELGAVIAAAPAAHVRREAPAPGDAVVLIGGRTGRDGCGGATGSSKSHGAKSLTECGAEVQKGNAPEERKLQRLFRNPKAAAMIKRCNDFGAGGVSVAIGELAEGLLIDLDLIKKKYDGLDGTELAISESQERMAVVLDPVDVDAFLALAEGENLEATVVARVTEEPRLMMRWRGRTIVDISRAFLNTNGAKKRAKALVSAPKQAQETPFDGNLKTSLKALVSDLNVCDKRGLSQRFDSTIGAGTVLMPFGGRFQMTPIQAMVVKIPVPNGETEDCSVMSWAFDPHLTLADPFFGAYAAVVESVAKLVATGGDYRTAYLTFQEYFERLRDDPRRWGKPLAALLGALTAQLELGLSAIGGKDSMSGSYIDMDVPPTLVSFAVSMADAKDVISPEFKAAGHDVVLLVPGEDGMLPLFDRVTELIRTKTALSAWAITRGGIAEGLFKMALGNRIGLAFDPDFAIRDAISRILGGFILELAEGARAAGARRIGRTIAEYRFVCPEESVDLAELEAAYSGRLEGVYPTNAEPGDGQAVPFSYCVDSWPKPGATIAKPRVLIPVFPGTNCEYDTANAFEKAGAKVEIFVVSNLSALGVEQSVAAFSELLKNSQILFLPGGFSGGDEPEGSGKFITAFLRNPLIAEEVDNLLSRRDGLIGGICNGFQALIKLGLVPYGRIVAPDENSPTLTFNTIGRHQSKLVYTRVASNKSPWLMHSRVGDVHLVPISHGEGRFIASKAMVEELARNGQIATQYADEAGNVSMDGSVNPNGSAWGIEGITSLDGRVFGKMGHSERVGKNLYKNVPGNTENGMFRGAVDYFQ